MYDISIEPKAFDQLAHLENKRFFAVNAFIKHRLGDNPQRIGKLLKEPYRNTWSARVGDMRIIYEIDTEKNVVTIIRIAHRAHVYRY